MKPLILRQPPSKEDKEWKFEIPQASLLPPPNARNDYIKAIQFTAEKISFQLDRRPSNRVLNSDDPSKFVLVSFGTLRFPDSRLADTGDYITRLMVGGLFLNGVQYRFYHHSNSQLRGRSCFMREAKNDVELDDRIYPMGDFGRIMNVAKRAKRIGLLFSGAELDYVLDPKLTTDIRDIKADDELFSDGCGLLSRKFSVELSRKKRIIFRGQRYTPCVFQIRYLGYKGVLMLHPELDKGKKHHVQFRDSMKKFTMTADHTFSVVGYSQPYAFGRLNNEIVVLLSSLGISNEKLVAKQDEYFNWIAGASDDLTSALDFLSCIGQYSLAERVMLNGLEDPGVSSSIRKLQQSEIASFRKNDKIRARMMIHNSRLLYGVCDPFQVLKEGEVYICVTLARKGKSTPINCDVLVVRNPCLHPGDCLKLRAVHCKELSHLVDCIVFASVARPGHHAAPSMSSGGDLDGDKFFVSWDPDLVPSKIAESYDYPPNKERTSPNITRADLARHFAAYNSAGLAKVASLHNKWVRCSPKGAMSSECQELNALHSQSVDGARIKIPDRLLTPPEPTEPYIIDLLGKAAADFETRFMTSVVAKPSAKLEPEDAEHIIVRLLQSRQNSLSEYELFNLALGIARRHSIDIYPFLPYLDMGALSGIEKCAILASVNPGPGRTVETEPWMWNSLFRSNLLSYQDLYQRNLHQPFSLQRLYSSRTSGMSTFFRYLHMATQDFTRKLLVIKTDSRFAVGVFMRGSIPWDEEPEVSSGTTPNDNTEEKSEQSGRGLSIVTCSFLPEGSSNFSTYRPCTAGYRLHCSDNNFQLYNKHRGDTFIFMTRPPAASGADVAVSIALQKFSASVQRQLGRLNRAPVKEIELHVVSNRDRTAHQLFDLWFEHVPTEQVLKRFEREITSYERNNLKDIDWTAHPSWLKEAFVPKHSIDTMNSFLPSRSVVEIHQIIEMAIMYHAHDELYWIFEHAVTQPQILSEFSIRWMDRHPPLAFVLLKAYPPSDSLFLHEDLTPLAYHILQSIIRSASQLRVACLVAIEKISRTIAELPLDQYIDILMLASLSIRAPQLVQEVLLVLSECRETAARSTDALRYAHKHALAVVFDRADEAADECPCDDDGKPTRQRTAPSMVRLSPTEKINQVKASVRVDAKASSVRLHSHVRLQAASNPEHDWVEAPVVDGVIVSSSKGEVTIEVNHPLPPEMANMLWKMYNAGSIATCKAMLEAILRLETEGEECCQFYEHITGTGVSSSPGENPPESSNEIHSVNAISETLNASQVMAVQSCGATLSLIWGPPGTGKTTVVIQMLRKLLRDTNSGEKILMTASTHNAVDNVLERFIKMNREESLLPDEQILRVATDQSKVNKALHHYTIDARVGGDLNENNKLAKKALERVKSAILVFTTCAGAGLGVLRKVNFDIALIDEASQITEACALIPLVKGVRKGILVGDHVQLRPTVRRMAKALEFDISLLERLYTGPNIPEMRKTMLDVQYRFPQELAAFPSREFYENRLQTGVEDSRATLEVLKELAFPWPLRGEIVVPTVFVQCSSEEDMGGSSKSNAGQVEVVQQITSLLKKPTEGVNDASPTPSRDLKVTVLSPYTKQVTALKRALPAEIPSFTIDSFQGRESDIIVFSTVRCNAEGDIGFVEDARRLNVMWTRARLALIIVGDRRTLCGNLLWKRAVESSMEVVLKPAS